MENDYPNYEEGAPQENKNRKKVSVLSIVCAILAVAGVCLLIAGIVFMVKSHQNFGNFDNDNFMKYGSLGSVCCFLGVAFLMIGVLPAIQKLGIKFTKHVQEQNKDDLADIANTHADIIGESVTKTAKNIKKGLADTKYCKYCGSEIDADSVYCNKCGKEQ